MLVHKLKFKWVILLLFVLNCPSSLSQRAIDPSIQREIDDYIQNVHLLANNATIMGLTVVQNDGEIFYSTGYGMANIEEGIPVENTTQFLVASITKSLTSILAAKLLHERFPEYDDDYGQIMDVPIKELLPEADFVLIDRFRSEHVSFRDLLGHRLCTFPDNLFWVADPFNTTEEISYRSRYTTEYEKCEIRSRIIYNNQMYVVAGDLVSLLGGKPFVELAQELVSQLGMVNTTFISRDDDYTQMPWRAMPYYVHPDDKQAYPLNPGLINRRALGVAAGGMFSTPNDMARYMRFLLNNGELDGIQIVPSLVMGWLTVPGGTYHNFGYKKSNEDKTIHEYSYGLGLVISTYDGWESIQHSGFLPPYTSQMSLFPEKNLAIFITTSMGPMKLDHIFAAGAVFDILNGASGADVAEKSGKFVEQMERKKKAESKQKADNFQKVFKKLDIKVGKANLAGSYGNGFQGDLEITERFNEEMNQTMNYLEYGRWYKGWIEDANVGEFIEIKLETDVYQDNYLLGYKLGVIAYGEGERRGIALVENYGGSDLWVTGLFEEGVSLDKLPPIPWDPNSC